MRRLLALLVLMLAKSAVAGDGRTLLELFTSQGCSSCPPADALAGRLLANPALIVLSFHVNYWDELGWKDPYGSQANTDRQYAYSRALRERTVFTPQVIVNGAQSVIGSQEGAIQHAIDATSRAPSPVHVDLTRRPDGRFVMDLTGPAVSADVWEVGYVRHAVTRVAAGENGGKTLETFNNVTRMRRLGPFASGQRTLAALQPPEDGLAVLVQATGTGRILGAAAY